MIHLCINSKFKTTLSDRLGLSIIQKMAVIAFFLKNYKMHAENLFLNYFQNAQHFNKLWKTQAIFLALCCAVVEYRNFPAY